MPTNEYDPPSAYRSFRVSAARKVERWIQRDSRVLGVFQERIRFAEDLHEAWKNERNAVEEWQRELWRMDLRAAMANPSRRDREASPPGPDYEWVHFSESYCREVRPTREDFRALRERGFVGTWEEIKRAWDSEHWGYWRRKCPDAVYNPWPWMQTRDNGAERQFVMPTEPAERMRAYYCFLAAIHDKDLAMGPTITAGIWCEDLLHYVHLAFWGYKGDKTEPVRTALECVEQDLDMEIARKEEETENGEKGSDRKLGRLKQAGEVARADDTQEVAMSIPDDAVLPSAKLAEAFQVSHEPLRKRLDRLRRSDHNCFIENEGRKAKEAKYLYRVGAVRPIIADMKASSKTSGERPARK